MSACQFTGKNQQQASNTALRQCKTWAKLLGTFAANQRLQVELINTIQMFCYEQNNLMKVFHEIIHLLYECDVCSEEAILHWCVRPRPWLS